MSRISGILGLLLFTLSILSLPAKSQTDSTAHKSNSRTPVNVSRGGISVDQDIFADILGLKGKNEDRNYTMGVNIFYSSSSLANSKVFSLFRFLPESWRQVKIEEGQEGVLGAVSFGGTAFTPRYLGDNLDDSLYYLLNDRPFSSLTFISFKYQTSTIYKALSNQVVIGVLGLDFARLGQTHIHRNRWLGSTREIPDGWKYQISEGGEPTFLFSNKADFLLSKKTVKENSNRHFQTQFIASREYRVGYYIGANAGMAVKIGWLDPFNWASYDAYQLQFANALAGGAPASPRRLKNEFYFQASVRPQLVLYNALLQGQLKDNFHELSCRQMNPIVIEGFTGLGFTVSFCQGSRAINSMVYLSGRTPEISTALSNRTHLWGGFQLSYTRLNY